MLEETIEVKDVIKKTGVKKGDYKLINYGSEFEELEPAHKVRYMKELSSSLNYALDLMQRERNNLAREILQLKALLSAAESAVSINKAVLHKTITENNEREQSFISDIQQLTAKVKKLES